MSEYGHWRFFEKKGLVPKYGRVLTQTLLANPRERFCQLLFVRGRYCQGGPGNYFWDTFRIHCRLDKPPYDPNFIIVGADFVLTMTNGFARSYQEKSTDDAILKVAKHFSYHG